MERKRKKWERTILPLMESDDFPFFLVSCPWKFPRISPGQVQNYQLLGGLLVSVKSIEKVTSTQDTHHIVTGGKRRYFASKQHYTIDYTIL